MTFTFQRIPVGICNCYLLRDDMTGGAEAGNKIRKLEYLLAEALSLECDTVITCGGEQSNHSRATALCAASLGLKTILYLRTDDMENVSVSGNLLLDRLADAEVRFMSPAQWPDRDRMMDQAADALLREGRRAYVIPEGGSNGLGALGYVEAMAEVRQGVVGFWLAGRGIGKEQHDILKFILSNQDKNCYFVDVKKEDNFELIYQIIEMCENPNI